MRLVHDIGSFYLKEDKTCMGMGGREGGLDLMDEIQERKKREKREREREKRERERERL
jgi:hypothetical protein